MRMRICVCVTILLLFCGTAALGASDEELRAELALARDTLASVRALVPQLQASAPSETAPTIAGYQGYTFVGGSTTRRKTFTVTLWGTSSVMPVIRGVSLQQPIDSLVARVERTMHDSFVLTVERTDGKVGWGQELWCTYFAEGRFTKVEQPSWAMQTPTDSSSAAQELGDLLHQYFSRRPRSTRPLSVPATSPAVLPLLRHLGGNFASVEQLWHLLISAHPQPRRAVVVEVGVADGAASMSAAELGVRVLAVEPNRRWVDSPPLVAKARARPNLELIHAAAASTDGETLFSGSGTGGRVVQGRRLLERFRGKGWGKHGGRSAKGQIGQRLGARKGQERSRSTKAAGTVRVPSLTLDSILERRNISHVFLVKVDVQGFELEVLRGLVRTLREQRVLYVLLEFWPRGMRQHGLDAYEVLSLLHRHGYTLFDSRALRLGGEASAEPLNAASTFRRPVSLRASVDWYLENDARYGAKFGYWTDVLAVASGAQLNLDLF